MKRIAAVLAIAFMLHSFAFSQAAGGNSTAEKAAPKTIYILAGRLFDATSDTVRQNVVITVEGERIKSVASKFWRAASGGRERDRPFSCHGAARTDRLPHAFGRPRRPV